MLSRRAPGMNTPRVLAVLFCAFVLVAGQQPPIQPRVEKLLAQMTLEEKVNHLLIPVVNPSVVKENFTSTSFGSYYVFSAANVSDRNNIQKYFIENSRLHLPVEWVQEALHSGAGGGTIFPMPLAMSATWNTDLVKRVHEVIALEANIVGAYRTFSPNMNIYTDPRFGRYQEGWGEDPFLTASMAVAAVSGLQGEKDSQGYINFTSHIISTSKHFAAYGKTEGGQDGTAADISERTLRDIYLPAFKAIIDKTGVGAIMPSHNEIDGVPSHGNSWLLTDLLRNEWGWKDGVVSSDFGDIEGLQLYHLVNSLEEAAIAAITAGVDMELYGTACSFATLVNAVKNGKLSVDVIDNAVRHVLYNKFSAGVFDKPYADLSRMSMLDNPQHRLLARQVAREATVLLKNHNNLLPLNPSNYKRIALIGPNTDDVSNTVGGYTQYGAHVVTPLEGIRNYISQKQLNIAITYAPGCYVLNDSQSLQDEAVQLARNSDLVLLFLGDSHETCREAWGGRTGDRASLDLPGGELSLLSAVLETGTTTVVILINGRPATFGAEQMNALLGQIQALLVAWRPGEEAGNALAEILFGDVNPSGKLISSWPFSVGQIGGPAQPYYQRYRQYDGRKYTFQPHVALFPFGFGMSYTSFAYSGLSIQPSNVTSQSTVIQISIFLKNTGNLSGADVVQLYLGDRVASIVRYKQQLKGFKKVSLRPQEQQKVTLSLAVSDLAFYDRKMRFVVEAGWFDVWVGSDCIATQPAACMTGSFYVAQSYVIGA